MQGFFNELRRRKVSRTAIVYAVVAWAIIESTSVIFPALHLPDWTVTFVVVLALIGFPVTLVLAWIFDLTREGIVRTPSRSALPPEQADKPGRGRLIDFAIIAVLLVVIAWLGWERVFDRPVTEGVTLDSIAVLPFVNMSGDPDNEFFGDGLAEELLNALVRVEGLRVAARTSSFAYRGQQQDVRRIAESLGVAAILEGSVRKAGDRVRVTAQLVRADDGFHLWSETYDRRMEDIFAVQDEIALAIVDALRVTLGTRERERVVARGTRDVEAFEAYLRGRFEMHQRSPESLRRATEEFRRAISRDPDYAAAYSGLSDTWMLRAEYDAVPGPEALRQAEPMARRALQLDPGLAEAHASLGLVLQNRGDYAGSVAPLERAIELNPSYSPAYHWLSIAYSMRGELGRSAEIMRRALEFDPGYVGGQRILLSQLRSIGAHEEADALAARLEREHGSDPLVIYSLSNDAMIRDEPYRAVTLAARAARLEPRAVHFRFLLASQLFQLGDLERASRQMEIAAGLAPEHPIVLAWPALRALGLGDADGVALAMQDYLARLPDSLDRARLACHTHGMAGLVAEARSHCLRMLDLLGWQPGEPLPPGGLDAAVFLYVGAVALQDQDRMQTFGPLVRDAIRQMAESGLDPRRVEEVEAMMAALHGDTDRLLAGLPDWGYYREGIINHVDLDPFLAPVRDEPRFHEILADREARKAALRQQVDRIPLPD
jgi:adenylate cyclase